MSLLTGLVAYWKLDEESGVRADSHGANDLADNNTVLFGAGKVGNAADFEEDNEESLSIADNADLSAGNIDFSWAPWVKLESKDTRKTFLGKLHVDGASTSVEYKVDYNNVTDRFRFSVGDGATLGSVEAGTFGSPALATWYQIIGWHDATANTINIAVNDGAVDSAAWATGSQNTVHGFALGRLGDYDVQFHHDGSLDEVGFWKKVLSAAERTQLYNGGDGLTYPFGVPRMVAIF